MAGGPGVGRFQSLRKGQNIGDVTFEVLKGKAHPGRLAQAGEIFMITWSKWNKHRHPPISPVCADWECGAIFPEANQCATPKPFLRRADDELNHRTRQSIFGNTYLPGRPARFEDNGGSKASRDSAMPTKHHDSPQRIYPSIHHPPSSSFLSPVESRFVSRPPCRCYISTPSHPQNQRVVEVSADATKPMPHTQLGIRADDACMFISSLLCLVLWSGISTIRFKAPALYYAHSAADLILPAPVPSPPFFSPPAGRQRTRVLLRTPSYLVYIICPPSFPARNGRGKHVEGPFWPTSTAKPYSHFPRSSQDLDFSNFTPDQEEIKTLLSSTSLVHFTAKGKPIPLDDDTTAHRTSALRELNTHYPSRLRYAKSTGTQNSAYSQPVLVRTYSGGRGRTSNATRSATGGDKAGYGPGTSVTSGTAASVRRVVAFRSRPGAQQYGLLSMARAKVLRGSQAHDATVKLPPIEAYSFKSMMANLEAEGGESDINADLDRIAEICARSRYSLSNQYEVHVAPHGSGVAFLASASSRRQLATGRTLQAMSSDDERNNRRHRKKASLGGKRRSVAIGTLETIISSSGSSEEGKSKEKLASEIAEEVRERTAQTASAYLAEGDNENTGSRTNPEVDNNRRKLTRKKSSSLATAMIGNARQVPSASDAASARNSSSTLLSEPALPKTSTSHLEVRTEPDNVNENASNKVGEQPGTEGPRLEAGDETQSPEPRGLLEGLSGWMPAWSLPPVMALSPASAQGGASPSHAEGSLRELLKSAADSNTEVALKCGWCFRMFEDGGFEGRERVGVPFRFTKVCCPEESNMVAEAIYAAAEMYYTGHRPFHVDWTDTQSPAHLHPTAVRMNCSVLSCLAHAPDAGLALTPAPFECSFTRDA
ncbi:hypothetical protein SODALDRAFT_355294 [Sodiomyces alkalinus F11]|uniref:Uncharacterized protein n=1 Tax=Sodiomyces alkalinus (strain CBS 110278 / VKM F-3762 / F11) TaxID=1314773 RepID=A0A3N2Q8J6_SODAK|nr:hypothetical protein SODALDRAFT_355294 [Sodiomyces alkalinus F11]ROT43099.1 hypothetical protein SODALDRAFT_355294 [Sodiomyces alkalinus F11]